MKGLGTLATRRRVLSGSVALGSALAVPAILSRPAGAAEFIFKMATTIPQDHPINPRAQQAAETINEKSGGRIKVEVFPGYVLGSSTSCLSQLRGGAIQLLTLSGSVLSTMVPVSTIYNAAFAFKTYDEVWAALDGKLGDYIRGKVVAAGMQPIGKHWDLGFRDMTTSAKPITSAADLKGLKIRVPVAPLFLSCFEALGAAPASINFDEVYSSLQTRLIDGEENDLLVIDTAKLYEVQKYCAVTGHIWDGYFTLANDRAWKTLPGDLQKFVSDTFADAALAERQDVVARTADTRTKLQAKGLIFNEPDRDEFKQALSKAGFYKQWREKFGEEAWGLLETTTGSLS